MTLRLYTIDDTFIDETTTKIHVRESKCDALKVRGITSTGSCRTPIVIGDDVTGWRTQPYATERLGGLSLFSSERHRPLRGRGRRRRAARRAELLRVARAAQLALTTRLHRPGADPERHLRRARPGCAARRLRPSAAGQRSASPQVKGLNIVGGDVRLFPGSPARATLLLPLKPPFDGTVPLTIGGAAAADDAADFSISAPDIALGPVMGRKLSFAHYGPGHADSHNQRARLVPAGPTSTSAS